MKRLYQQSCSTTNVKESPLQMEGNATGRKGGPPECSSAVGTTWKWTLGHAPRWPSSADEYPSPAELSDLSVHHHRRPSEELRLWGTDNRRRAGSDGLREKWLSSVSWAMRQGTAGVEKAECGQLFLAGFKWEKKKTIHSLQGVSWAKLT